MVGRRDAGVQRVALIPLLLAIVVLLAISTPTAKKGVSNWKTIQTESEMRTISAAFRQYFEDTSYWPEAYSGESDERTSFRNFDCLYRNSKSLAGWRGPYLENGTDGIDGRIVARQTGADWEGLVDHWGRPFRVVYRSPRSSDPDGGIALVSSGPNLRFETSDENAVAGRSVKDDLVTVVAEGVSRIVDRGSEAAELQPTRNPPPPPPTVSDGSGAVVTSPRERDHRRTPAPGE